MVRTMPSPLTIVKNVFGLLMNVKMAITIRIARNRPPSRRAASRARPVQRLPSGLATVGAVMVVGSFWLIPGLAGAPLRAAAGSNSEAGGGASA